MRLPRRCAPRNDKKRGAAFLVIVPKVRLGQACPTGAATIACAPHLYPEKYFTKNFAATVRKKSRTGVIQVCNAKSTKRYKKKRGGAA